MQVSLPDPSHSVPMQVSPSNRSPLYYTRIDSASVICIPTQPCCALTDSLSDPFLHLPAVPVLVAFLISTPGHTHTASFSPILLTFPCCTHSDVPSELYFHSPRRMRRKLRNRLHKQLALTWMQRSSANCHHRM